MGSINAASCTVGTWDQRPAMLLVASPTAGSDETKLTCTALQYTLRMLHIVSADNLVQQLLQ